MPATLDVDVHRVKPGARPDLSELPTRYDGTMEEEEAKERLAVLQDRLLELEDLLYAEQQRSVLVILQAMDAIGKDSTIRRCFGPLNPQRCRTHPFKRPTPEEQRHDFLWRAHAVTPGRGMIQIWNRSHYEDVLVPVVMGSVSKKTRKRRYAHINAFEELLADEGTAILKFYLHASKDYQGRRLRRRLETPEKRWKFEPADIAARARWDDFITADTGTITAYNAAHAASYEVPAERRWYRDLVIVQAVVDRLEAMNPKTPEPHFDPNAIDIDDPTSCRK